MVERDEEFVAVTAHAEALRSAVVAAEDALVEQVEVLKDAEAAWKKAKDVYYHACQMANAAEIALTKAEDAAMRVKWQTLRR